MHHAYTFWMDTQHFQANLIHFSSKGSYVGRYGFTYTQGSFTSHTCQGEPFMIWWLHTNIPFSTWAKVAKVLERFPAIQHDTTWDRVLHRLWWIHCTRLFCLKLQHSGPHICWYSSIDFVGFSWFVYTVAAIDTPGSRVHGNLISGVLDGTIYTNDEIYYIEPAHR